MTVRHLLADDDLAPEEQQEIIELALAMKADPYGFDTLAGPRAVALMFDKPSTRTRVSFEVGVAELHGHPMVIDTTTSQLGRGESLADTAGVFARQVAAVTWRTDEQRKLEELAAASAVPVINALTDDFHPCQLLADLMTIRERLGDLAGRTLSYYGDGANNMAHSYLLAGATAGMHVRITAPVGLQPDPAVVERADRRANETGGSVMVTDNVKVGVLGADVLATDTWFSMGHDDDPDKAELLAPYQINAPLLRFARRTVVVLHCLPAYRGKEITAEVLDGPHSAVWDEAENRRHAQKALLHWLLEHSDGEVSPDARSGDAGSGG